MNSSDFITADHILSEILFSVDDKEFKKGFPKGWYISRISDALRELAFDTMWQKVTKNYDIPQNCQIKMPTGVFNVREITVYNGEDCTPGNSQTLFWKRTFDNRGGNGDGYIARIKDDGSQSNDIFLPNQAGYANSQSYNLRGTKYYYNVENDLIMISASCRAFKKIRIKFNGNGVVIGDLPIIPQFFERAVVDYVEERFYNAMKGKDPRKFRVLWSDAYARLNDRVDGSWNKAKKRVSSMDKAQKESLDEYISNMIHK